MGLGTGKKQSTKLPNLESELKIMGFRHREKASERERESEREIEREAERAGQISDSLCLLYAGRISWAARVRQMALRRASSSALRLLECASRRRPSPLELPHYDGKIASQTY